MYLYNLLLFYLELKEVSLLSKEFFEYVKSIGINASGESMRITSSDINNYMF